MFLEDPPEELKKDFRELYRGNESVEGDSDDIDTKHHHEIRTYILRKLK